MFQEYDRLILDRLGPEYVYTRYVDDITVSVSRGAATRLGIPSKQDLRNRVVSIVETVLRGSPFRLQPRKTQATAIDKEHGKHSITGLSVGAERVNLHRETRRRLRGLFHSIRRKGFVRTAVERFGGELHAQMDFDMSRERHMRQRRRLSTEKLAVLMLKHRNPDLRIEVPCEAWNLGGRRIFRPVELHEGKDAWRDVERILSRLWENELGTEPEEGHLAVFELAEDGSRKVIARLRSENRLDFFRLSKREAIACVELWHLLHGWQASLNPGDPDSCFANIVNLRKKLKELLDGVQIDASSSVAARPTPPFYPRFSVLEDVGPIRERAAKAYNELRQFVRHVTGRPPSSDFLRYASDFTEVATSVDGFKDWLDSARGVCIDKLPKQPALANDGSTSAQRPKIFDVIRILDDRMRERRCKGYEVEGAFLRRTTRKPSVDKLSDEDVPAMQQEILRLIAEELERSNKHAQQIGMDQWPKTLEDNHWSTPLDERLRNAAKELIERHAQCHWKTTREEMFRETARQVLLDGTEQLKATIPEGTSHDVWQELFRFANTVASATFDSLAGDLGTLSDAVRQRITKLRHPSEKDLYEEFYEEVSEHREHFEILFLMRNRAAHPEDPAKSDEWRRIQKYAAKQLGRRVPKKSPTPNPHVLFQLDDLQLTALEGNELKECLLVGACEGLRRLERA